MQKQQIHTQLEKFSAELGHWPKVSDFARHGRKSLLEAIVDCGGLTKWEKEFGIVTHRGMTPKQIQRDLKLFLKGRRGWPSHGEFLSHGYQPLYAAMRSNGGTAVWAGLMGRQPNPKGRPKGKGKVPTRWTYDMVRTELRTYLDDHTSWPTEVQFVADGQRNLLHAVRKHGGKAFWMQEFGLEPKTRHGGAPKKWTHEEISRQLTEFCEGRTSWPGHKEFRSHRRYALLKAVQENGGFSFWALRMGYPDPRRRDAHSRKWNNTVILTMLGELIGDSGAWPTIKQFDERPGLYTAVRTYGGVAFWADTMGVKPNRRGRKPLCGDCLTKVAA